MLQRATVLWGPSYRWRYVVLLVIIGLPLAEYLYIGNNWNAAFRDDWSYYVTSQHLASTGQYALNQWSAVDIRAMAYWGAIFIKLFGATYNSVRLSTLLLVPVCLGALYGLSLECKLNQKRALLVVVGFAACPIVIRLSFSFMTEIPFMTALLMSIWLLLRGFRRSSMCIVALASVFASISLFIRPQGAAIAGGLLLMLVIDHRRRQRAPLYAVALALPLLATAIDFWLISRSPVWGQQFNVAEERSFLSGGGLFEGLLWRPGFILIYLAVLTLPLTVVALPSLVSILKVRSRATTIGKVIGVAVVVLSLWSAVVLDPQDTLGGAPFMKGDSDMFSGNLWLAVIMLIGAPAAALFMAHTPASLSGGGRRQWGDDRRIVVCFAVAYVVLTLVSAEILDEYLLPLVPVTLVLLAPRINLSLRHLVPTALIAAVLVGTSSGLTRADLALRTAQTAAADAALRNGVPSQRVWANWTWYGPHNFQSVLDRSATVIDPYVILLQETLNGPRQGWDEAVAVAPLPPHSKTLGVWYWYDAWGQKNSVYLISRQ